MELICQYHPTLKYEN